MQRSLIVTLGMLVMLAVGTPALAQQSGSAMEEVGLSLDDVLQMALENNLDLVEARKDPEIAEWSVTSEASSFDPSLDAITNHRESKDEPGQTFTAARSTVDTWSLTWSDPLRFGASYSVGLNSTRVDAPNPFRTVNPDYRSNLSLDYRMPLLRGLGKEVASERLLVAKRNLEISLEDLRLQAHLTLEAAEGAYWDLLARREAVRVAYESLQRAQDLLELNRKKVEVGTLAPIDVTQAEAGVASQEEAVIVAETALENAEDELRRLLAMPAGDPMWGNRLTPLDRPKMDREVIDLQSALAQALGSRPEMRTARKNLLNRELNERAARNRLRPGLDLSAGITPSGNNLKGVTILPGPDGIPGTIDDTFIPDTGGLGESLSEIPEFNAYDWEVGLTLNLPLRNRAAKAAYATSTLNREKSEIALQSLEQNIRVEVRSAVRAVDSGFKRVEAARANVVLQKKKLEAEQKKFDNGMSTSFQVLEFQNDLSQAELSLIRAALDYVKALTAVERAKGTLLEARGLRLE